MRIDAPDEIRPNKAPKIGLVFLRQPRNLALQHQTEKEPLSMTPAEVKQAIEDGDDFGHEMRVGHLLHRASLLGRGSGTNPGIVEQLRHGGAYKDPVTGKSRQFDYRCRMSRFSQAPWLLDNVWLAVECKNLHHDSPLVICGRSRTDDEAYHGLIASWKDDANSPFSTTQKISGHQSLYKPAEFVGKSVLRLQRERGNKKGTLKAASDPDVFDRWAQALASSVEMAESALSLVQDGPYKRCCSVILPVVVLPNDTLWTAHYCNDGSLIKDPSTTDDCTFFVDAKPTVSGRPFALTHIHFTTIKGFGSLLNSLTNEDQIWSDLFNPNRQQMQ
ncbi:MAG: hypothetical protein NT154_21545 [Verrucomicrobia bacterium]|nr:hypothetical protein [Verrucomicrobiota bacterium]